MWFAISTQAFFREMMLQVYLTIGFPLLIAFAPLLFGMNKLAIAEMFRWFYAVLLFQVYYGLYSKIRWLVLG